LKTKLIYQTNTIKEYDSWVGLIINIINSKVDPNNHYDYGTSIQKGLEKIEHLENENFELKRKYLREVNKNRDKQNIIKDIQSQMDLINQDFKEGNKDELLKEKNQLLESINTITEEVFYFSF
jgi:hypothetical protein